MSIKYLLFISLLFNLRLFAQDYVKMMQDPAVNFYQVQQAFNTYWENKPLEKGKGYNIFKRWEEYMEPRVYPSGDMTLPTQNYTNFITWQKKENQQSNFKSVGGDWALLGPIGKPNGGGAGRINFIRFDPNNLNIIYVGTPDGGLWKSSDGGLNWSTNTNNLSILGVSDIAIDPNNSQNLYIATGDSDAGDTYSLGVMKSSDGGITWNTTGLTWNASEGKTISKLLINPNNPLVIIAFGNTGIQRSIDGGNTWSPTVGGTFSVKDAEFKPNDPNTIYAAGSSLKKSTDGGFTWTAIPLSLTGINRMAIAVTPSNPNYVYILASSSSNSGFLGLLRSTDSGVTFTTRMAQSATNNILGYDNGTDTGGQGWYDLALAASPTNSEEIISGGINMWKSTDGGLTFTLFSHWYGGYNKPYVHADIHDIIYLPGSGTTILSGNDGGIFKTTNSGVIWDDISSNLSIAQQYRIGLSATNPSLFIAGHQDNGTNKASGINWSRIYGGDGMDCFIDRTNNSTMFASYVYGQYYRSTNSGNTWTNINNGLIYGSANASWLCAWHQDPLSENIIYAGGRNSLFKSTDNGVNWLQLGTPTGSGYIKEFAVSPSNNQIIYTIKNGVNGISKSIDGGNTFTPVSNGLPTTVAPTNITISNTNSNIVYITYSGYEINNKIYKTTDGGNTWTNISSGLPNLPVNAIVYQNNSANDAIYIGMDIGVYFKDNSTNWILFNTGLPNVAIRDLEIYYPTNRLRCATYGRGTWDTDLYSPLPAIPTASFTSTSPTICSGQTVTFNNTSSGVPTSYLWSFPGGIPSTSTSINPVITYNSTGQHTVSLTVSNSSGTNTLNQSNYINVLGGDGIALPLSEGFTSNTFPPLNWSIVNIDLGASTWARNNSVGNTPSSSNSMWFNNFSINDNGNKDEVRTTRLNFQNYTSAFLNFDVAYASYSGNVDGLEVLVSSDCGLHYTSVYFKTGSTIGPGNLPTAPTTSSLFIPTATQWRTETINLSAFAGLPNIIIAFRNIAGYGNALYIDNISITGSPAPGTFIWTGATSSNPLIANNWNPSQIPLSSQNIIIPSGLTNYPVFNNITIDPGASINIQTGGNLDILGQLNNNGEVTIESGATLVQGPGCTLSGSGVYNVKQFVSGSGGGIPSGRFWYIGVPINNLNRSTAFGAASSSNLLWSWSEPSQLWSGQLTDNTPLLPTTGYAFRTGVNTTLNFSGNSLYNINSTITGLTNSLGAYNGCHLISNPYTAYLDWEEVIASPGTSNLSSTYCIRTFNETSSTMVYDTYNANGNITVNPSGNIMTQFIAPMQSFWVRVNPGTSGSINMSKNMLSHQSSLIGLKDISSFPAFARLNLINGDFYDQTVVYTANNASFGKDEYDSQKFLLTNKPQLYFSVGDDKFVINALKHGKSTTSAPLTIELPIEQNYLFEMVESYIDNGFIILEDKLEGISQDMNINPTYEFHSNAGTFSDRFVLHFFLPNGNINGTEDLEGDKIIVNITYNGAISVELSEIINCSGVIEIFDETGRLIEQESITDFKTIFQLKNHCGIYFIKIQTPNLTEVKKIMLL